MQEPQGSYAPAISPFAAETGTKPLPCVPDAVPECRACCVSETLSDWPKKGEQKKGEQALRKESHHHHSPSSYTLNETEGKKKAPSPWKGDPSQHQSSCDSPVLQLQGQ